MFLKSPLFFRLHRGDDSQGPQGPGRWSHQSGRVSLPWMPFSFTHWATPTWKCPINTCCVSWLSWMDCQCWRTLRNVRAQWAGYWPRVRWPRRKSSGPTKGETPAVQRHGNGRDCAWAGPAPASWCRTGESRTGFHHLRCCFKINFFNSIARISFLIHIHGYTRKLYVGINFCSSLPRSDSNFVLQGPNINQHHELSQADEQLDKFCLDTQVCLALGRLHK